MSFDSRASNSNKTRVFHDIPMQDSLVIENNANNAKNISRNSSFLTDTNTNHNNKNDYDIAKTLMSNYNEPVISKRNQKEENVNAVINNSYNNSSNYAKAENNNNNNKNVITI